MSWLFSQALVEEYSAEPCTDGEPSAQLNVTLTPHKFWRNDKTMEFSKLSQFGLTLRLLTDDHGAALLTSFLAASLARTSVRPALEQESRGGEAACGVIWRASFAKLILTTLKWKTAQCSLLGDSELFSETWPRWGSLVTGASWVPVMSARRINENGFGSKEKSHGEQNACANQAVSDIAVSTVWNADGASANVEWSIDGFGTVYEAEILLEGVSVSQLRERRSDGGVSPAPSKKEQGAMLRALFLSREFASSSQGQKPSEQLCVELADTLRELSQQRALEGSEGKWIISMNSECWERPIPALPTFESASGLWQTPVADDAVNRVRGKWNSRGEPKLSAQVLNWPTPTASLGTNGGLVTPKKAREGGTLFEAVSARTWPTPCASASKGSSPASLTRKTGTSRANDRIDHAVMASDGGQLNPEWVEWLMGWPIGWTELKPLEMDRFHEWKRQHGGF